MIEKDLHTATEKIIDPICGMTVNPETAAGNFQHEGATYYFCSKGCLEKFKKQIEIPKIQPQIVQLGRRKVSEKDFETLVDPVCKMLVKPETAAGNYQYQNETFYFCSTGCLNKFRQTPEKFLNPDAAPEPMNEAAQDVEYTCPMDPEIVQIGPGICPICGMALEPKTFSLDDKPDPEYLDMKRRFRISAWLTVPVFALAMAEMLPNFHQVISPQISLWIQFALATPVVLYGGLPFFERGWNSVVNRKPNMFTLIAIGTGAAYLFSLFALFFPNIFPAEMRDAHTNLIGVYFEAAAVITTLVLLGQLLELRARSQTSGAIRELLGLAPTTATIIFDDETEAEIELKDLQKGAKLRVKANEKIPTDGVILEGAGVIDESMITGEPIPVEKTVGERVIGGTINGNRTFTMRAERVGSETLLSQIVRMVGEAQRSRAPIQRVADSVSAYFVPAIIFVAVLAFGIWAILGSFAFALASAVSVLIIACPCALGLATPMSIMVGTGRGAKAGILIKKAEALEILERVNTIVVDKTGTLTMGKPRLQKIISSSSFSEDEILGFAAALEKSSEHPLAGAIIKAAEERNIKIAKAENFQSTAGVGLIGRINGKVVKAGNPKIFNRESFSPEFQNNTFAPPLLNAYPKEIISQIGALLEKGQTLVYVEIDGEPVGVLGIADSIKDSARAAIIELHKHKIEVVMLTGDNAQSAKVVAGELGIDKFYADVLPGEKADKIRELQAEGKFVAMAGDGVNDAPALAQANVGIAMGTGTDVAIESADITLLKGDLLGILRARNLSKATMKNIRQNLFFAFAYNLIGVPIAAGVLYPVFGLLLSPMIASAAMTFSSFSVIMNALRLRNLKL